MHLSTAILLLSSFAILGAASLRNNHRPDRSSSSFIIPKHKQQRLLQQKHRQGRASFGNDNLRVESPGKSDLGSRQTVSCTLPQGQSVYECDVVTPGGEVWRVAGGLVLDAEGNPVPGYAAAVGDPSTTCGLDILTVRNIDFGDWQCQIVRDNGATPFVHGHVSLRNETLVPNVRLQGNVIPSHYNLRIIPLIQPDKVLHGEFSINAEVFGDQVGEIVLHILEMSILEETVKILLDGVIEIPITSHGYDFDREFYIVGFVPPSGSHYMIQISGRYTASLQGQELGFYYDSYTDSSQTLHELAVTHLEPTNARNVFPCFDEPAMKATFAVSLAHTPEQKALANMPATTVNIPVDGYPGFLWDEFETSVKMSTYLVALAVSDFAFLECETLDNGVETTIWARPEAIALGWADWAKSYAAENLRYYEELFQLPYPLPKMDLFVPPSRSGAMENWGLVTFGEAFFLFDPVNGGPAEKELATSVVTHELVHQWFGNLVTMAWWNGLWLNEGFATYASYHGAEHVSPEMTHWDRFTIDEMHGAIELDSYPTSHPINFDITNPVEIDGAFDRISYDKGASILRMLESFLTKPTFLKGVNQYLSELQFGNAEQDDLWNHLDTAGHSDGTLDADKDIRTIMETWTEQMNYPLLTVQRIDANSARLQQTRFLIGEDQGGVYRWWIPITYTAGGAASSDFIDTSTKLFMAPSEATKVIAVDAPVDAPLIFNLQQTGFYRVNYDEDNWGKIASLLQTNHEGVHLLNRAQILDDSFTLAENGFLSYPTALSLTRYLDIEADYVPYFAVNVHVRRLEAVLRYSEGYPDYKVYMQSKTESRMRYLGIDESETTFTFIENLMRLDVLPVACLFETQSCTSLASARLNQWMGAANPSDPAQNPFGIRMRRDLYCAAAKAEAESVWPFLLEQHSANAALGAADKQALLYALTCPEDQSIMSDLLTRVLDDSDALRQDIVNVVGLVTGNVVGKGLVWQWLETNWLSLAATGAREAVAVGIASKFAEHATEQVDADLVQGFLTNHGAELSAENRQLIEESIAQIEENITWRLLNYSGIIAWLQNENY